MRKFIKSILIIINIAIAFAYLVGCLLPWLSPDYFWLFGFIGFGFLYLAIAMLIITIFWLFIKWKYALLSLIIFCCGYKQIITLFAFNSNTIFNKTKPDNTLRVVSWNVGNLSGKTQEKNAVKHKQVEIVDDIILQNADLVCLQEFAEIRENPPKAFLELQKKYPYYYFPWWIVGPYRHRSGNVIFSKYPIVFKDSAAYNNGETIIRCDIAKDDDTISIFSTHFDSYRFNRNEFEEIDGNQTIEANNKKNWKQIIKKVKNTMQIHNAEADVALQFMSQSIKPSLFCADMNEVPNNYIYWKLRTNKQDAFLQKGFGLGKTFNSLSAQLRIDYILTDNRFKIYQFNIVDNGLSDHAMLVSDVELIK